MPPTFTVRLAALRYQRQSATPTRASLGEEADTDQDLLMDSGPCVWAVDPRLVCVARTRIVGDVAGWELGWTPSPAGPPPPAVTRRSAALTGGQTLLEQARAATPMGPIAIDLRHRLSAADWDCPALRQPLPSSLSTLAEAVECEQIGLRLIQGPSGLQELFISYLHNFDEWELRLVGVARQGLSPPEDWMASPVVEMIHVAAFSPRGRHD